MGSIPAMIIFIFGCRSLSLDPHNTTLLAMSCGPWARVDILLTPQWITPTETEAGRYMLSTRHRTFCVRSPPIPQFTVLYGDRWVSHTLGYRDRLATRESPRRTTFALFLIMDLKCLLCVAYQSLLDRNSGFCNIIGEVISPFKIQINRLKYNK